MRISGIEAGLLRELEQFEIIDCHEHIGPESTRLRAHVDAFTFLSHYLEGDLAVAGMSRAHYDAMLGVH